MPKFNGINTKALEVRQRKHQAALEKREALKAAELDTYWKDDDKKTQKKLNRKMEKLKKAEDKMLKKSELKQLFSEEDEKMKTISRGSSKSTGSNNKVTRADIISTMLAKVMDKKEDKNDDYAIINETPLEPNINHVKIMEELSNDQVEIINVSGINEALDALYIGEKIDMHPEKRMRMAYAAFESSVLPKLKIEHPNFKLSQYKNIIQKMWKKSPENPMNTPK